MFFTIRTCQPANNIYLNRREVYPSHDVCNFTSIESFRQVRTRLPGETDKIAVSPSSFFFCFVLFFVFNLFLFFFSTACVCMLRYRRIGSCLSCAYILRVMNALGNFKEHSRAFSCVSKLPACIHNSTCAH